MKTPFAVADPDRIAMRCWPSGAAPTAPLGPGTSRLLGRNAEAQPETDAATSAAPLTIAAARANARLHREDGFEIVMRLKEGSYTTATPWRVRLDVLNARVVHLGQTPNLGSGASCG